MLREIFQVTILIWCPSVIIYIAVQKTISGMVILEKNELGTGILENTKVENNMGAEFKVGVNMVMVLVFARNSL